MFTNPPTPPLHSEVQLHSTAAVVNQLSCAPDTQGWLADSPAATPFERLHPCLWTCATLSQHLKHTEHLMHSYTPTPQHLLWDTVSKPSLKPSIPEGFSSTVPIWTLRREFQRIWERRPTEKFSTKPSDGIQKWKKSFIWVDESATTEKMRSCTSRTARRAKKPRHPDFQDNMPKMPSHTHHSCWLQALQATCYQTVGVWKALGRQCQTQGRIMGREENETKKKLDRDQILPHGTEQ